MDTDHWITAVLALRKAHRVVVFTGAGVSAESGIPTFRSADGFWQRFPPEQFARWNSLTRMLLTNRRRVAEFILNVLEPISLAEPNRGHLAIAEIERRVPTTVVTQNIDGLHQSAGSKNVCEIHGSLFEVVDIATGKLVHRFERDDLIAISHSLRSYVDRRLSFLSLISALRRQYPFDWRNRNRPNLVLFGDSLAEPAWTRATEAITECDLLLSIGTSGFVYPAATLPARAEAAGATIVYIGPQPNPGCWLEGSAAEILDKLVSAAFPNK
jgi:NAD-dependent deacetylase